jgi:hypothetical protein
MSFILIVMSDMLRTGQILHSWLMLLMGDMGCREQVYDLVWFEWGITAHMEGITMRSLYGVFGARRIYFLLLGYEKRCAELFRRKWAALVDT